MGENFLEKLLSDRVRELMILISQVDNKQKENLLTIFIFLNQCESSNITQGQDHYIKVMKKYYADLVVGVNKREYKVDITIYDLFDFHKFANNFLAVGLHFELLDRFINLTPYEQNNLLKIIKFICSYQKEKMPNHWNVLRNNYRIYTELIQKIKLLGIS